jgi:hypothetical protein
MKVHGLLLIAMPVAWGGGHDGRIAVEGRPLSRPALAHKEKITKATRRTIFLLLHAMSVACCEYIRLHVR